MIFTAAGAPALPAGYKEIPLGEPSSPVKIPANEKGEQIPVTLYPDEGKTPDKDKIEKMKEHVKYYG